MQTPVTFIVAFIIVLALIGVVTWLIRRFAANKLGSNGNRGRMPRLAVIDAATVDGRRRLVLVRRDNIEHLLMIGGPSDIVVESNIVRAPQRDPAQPRTNMGDMPSRPVPFPDAYPAEDNDADQGVYQPAEPPAPDFPPRPARPSFSSEPRRPAPQPERRSADSLSDFTPEPLARPEPRITPRSETPPIRPREPLLPRGPLRSAETATRAPVAEPPARPEPAAPAPAPSAEDNLAEMAQRLEAALRRPGSPASAAAAAPAPASPSPASPLPAASAPAASKGAFENLEDEMASLLGRPKSPT